MVGWHHQLNGHEFVQTSGDEEMKDREAWHASVMESQSGPTEQQSVFCGMSTCSVYMYYDKG